MFTYIKRQLWRESNICRWWQKKCHFWVNYSYYNYLEPTLLTWLKWENILCFVSNLFLFHSVIVDVLWGQLVNSAECWYDQQCSSCISYDSFWCGQHSTLQPACESSWQGDLLPTVNNTEIGSQTLAVIISKLCPWFHFTLAYPVSPTKC